VAILGGLGNSMGAVAAGLLLGLLEALVTSQSSAYKEAVSIVVLLLILVLRPSGLFARRATSALRTA
jgi:branched-chain amino acid transport system permease protein